MTAPAEPVLFQAVCTPPRSLTRRGFGAFAVLLGVVSAALGGLFLAIGAWPVLPFLGAELVFALAMVALHVRGAARRSELLLLVPGRLSIARTDARGRREEIVLDPYWARVTHHADPGGAGRLLLESRGRVVEIGHDLGAEDKASLQQALHAALVQARRPDFG
ncbi:DUF2244 domain-containing protein [Roseomonas sp. CECT 9278]|uniref:DUF2244 domain-containing protein n=1 Tax=Roseomonas sp. CECT 9278 TaxID=2845823 RepID=UPI001E5596B2|nr:DUF2244 domain-containing protein [Roseomonas sp. CECT 9278]CAH0149182.1 hypothetical protein ROS9278_00674 [Roseomonas sp. CECT 9278]